MILDLGVLISSKIEEKVIAGKKAFRDSSMANDSVATNFEQIFAAYSPETVRKVL